MGAVVASAWLVSAGGSVGAAVSPQAIIASVATIAIDNAMVGKRSIH
jgi:hypothetical protein